MRIHSLLGRRLLVGVLAIALFAALGLRGHPAQAADLAKAAMSWVVHGGHMGFWMAQDRGFYKEANIRPDLARGFGSGDTIKRVASRVVDFGEADSGSLIVARSRGMKVRNVGIIYDLTQLVLYSVRGSGINSPKDLEGRSVGGSSSGPDKILFPAFLSANNIDGSKVRWVPMSPAVISQSLLPGKVDAIVTFVLTGEALKVQAAKVGKSVVEMRYPDYGLDMYAAGIVTSEELINGRADFVRRFVGATLRGYAWAVGHSEQAVKRFVALNPATSEEMVGRQWKVTMRHMLTERTCKNGLGYMDQGKMKKTRDLLFKYMKLEEKVEVNDIFTNRFLPKVFAKKGC
ncbi:MAG: ABC transporter substrate-binding protein [Nitrospinota bacterium]